MASRAAWHRGGHGMQSRTTWFRQQRCIQGSNTKGIEVLGTYPDGILVRAGRFCGHTYNTCWNGGQHGVRGGMI